MQLRTSQTICFFDEMFRKKFAFKEYTSLEEPTLFFGVYSNNDAKAIKKHTGVKMVLLNGTDSTYEHTINLLKEDKAITVIAGSKWVAEDLRKAGIEHTQISFFLDDLYAWKNEPLGSSLYWYGANNSKYGKKYLREVRKAIPDLDIIILDQKQIQRGQMADIYKKCFACLRPVDHDGQSQTVAEMGLMGRLSIWNGETPFSRSYRSVEEMIELIKTLRMGSDYKLTSRRTELYFREEEKKWADLVLDKCGVKGIDCSGIFSEDEGRCASIFRIQRKADIEKIGGLGAEQFERPWFSAQMKNLGKKQLITTKASGWASKEWKGSGNKGYPEGTKFHTYDEKYS
jgi:hypothetical protein